MNPTKCPALLCSFDGAGSGFCTAAVMVQPPAAACGAQGPTAPAGAGAAASAADAKKGAAAKGAKVQDTKAAAASKARPGETARQSSP